MPTSEERLEVLEQALSRLQTERATLDERITVLQQQIAEQRKRLSGQEQTIGQVGQSLNDLHRKFDGLTDVLARQFSAMHQQFAAITARYDATDTNLHQHFTSIDTRFSRLEQQIDRQTTEIKEKFEASDHFAARTWGVVQAQQADIRAIKESLDNVDQQQTTSVKEAITDLDIKYDRLERHITDLHAKAEEQSQEIKGHGQLLLQILDRLPPAQ